MNIILVSSKLAKAKSLSMWQTVGLLAGLVLVPVLLTLLFITPKSNIKEQGVKAMLPPQLKSTIVSSQMHLDAYAKELEEIMELCGLRTKRELPNNLLASSVKSWSYFYCSYALLS